MKIPCFNCNNRIFGCHSGCDKYKEYKKEKDYLNSKRREYYNSEIYKYKRDVMPKNSCV